MSNLDLKLAKINKWLLFSLPILPLLFIDGFFYPFVLGRTIFFRTVILVVATIQAYLFFKKPNFKFTKNWSLISFGVLILWYIISAILGLDFYKSFFSTFERFEGIILWVFLWVYLWLLQVNFKKIADWYSYFRITVLMSFFVSIYAIIQKFSIFNVFHAGIDRAASTLDNAAFLGAYLLLALALGLVLFFKDKAWQRWFWLGVNLVNLWVLYLTYTRSALLGLLVALFILVWLYLWSKKSWYRALSIGLVLLVIVSGFLLKTNLASSNNFLVNRFVNVWQDASIQNRLIIWQKSLASAPEHLLTGVGWENFDIVYNKFYTPNINEDWFDRSHNVLVDLLVMTGVIGLALYLLWYLIFLVKAYRFSKIDRRTGLILFSFLLGYFVNNLFLFETINTAFILVALFGFVFFQAPEQATEPAVPAKLLKFLAVLRWLPIVVALVLFYYVVYLPASINRQLFNGYNILFSNKEKAYADFVKASSHDYAINEVSKQLQDAYLSLVSVNTGYENRAKFFLLAQDNLWKSTRVYPWDIRINLHLSQLIINYNNTPAELKKAEDLLLKAKELSPYRPEVYYLLGQVYISQKDEAKSIAIIEELDQRLPNFADTKFTLANLYLSSDKPKAENYFETAIKLPYATSKDNYERIIFYLLKKEDYTRVLPYLLALIETEEWEYKYRLDLSRVYYLTGDLDAAIEQINIIRGNAPTLLSDQQDYLNLLEQAKNKQ